jgi:hypothetical protein
MNLICLSYQDNTKVNKVEYYKLNSLHGKKLNMISICTVYPGPWLVEVMEFESCYINQPNTYYFDFNYPPVSFSFSWQASSLEPIPLPDGMQIISEIGIVSEFCSCCGNRKMCHGICIPIEMECKDPIPR